MAKDYLIEVRVKNGYLHGKMREKGFHTNVALSEKSGVDQSRISEFLNLRSYPMSLEQTDIPHQQRQQIASCAFPQSKRAPAGALW